MSYAKSLRRDRARGKVIRSLRTNWDLDQGIKGQGLVRRDRFDARLELKEVARGNYKE